MPKAQLNDLFSALSGSLGDVVITSGKRGTVLRKKPAFPRPTSPEQKITENCLVTANTVWSTFTSQEAEMWNDYALTVTHHNAQADTRYHPTGYHAFIALTLKFLQVTPTVIVPRTPPTRKFTPDDFTVTLKSENGTLIFLANGINSPNTETELLLQVLPNPRRKPTAKYHSEMFVKFTALAPFYALTVVPGAYAAAYRFVDTETGQMSPLVTLGKAEVALWSAKSEKKAA